VKARFLVTAQFGLLGALIFAKGDRFPVGAWAEVVPPILYLLGFLTLLLAYVALGPSLRVSPIPREGAPLIVHGIYKWIRHPMYVGVILIGSGLAIRNLSYVSIGLWALLVINLLFKANYEDELLRKAHSNAHTYQQQVRGILLTKKKR